MKRSTRALGFAGAAVLVLASGYRLAKQPGTAVTYELVTVALAAAVGILAVVLGSESRFPDTLMITDDRFVFVFGKGASREFRWADPKLHVVFRDSRYRQSAIEHPEKFSCFLSVNLHPVWLPTCPLTEVAYGSLLHAAEKKGLRVQPNDWSSPTSGVRIVILSSAG
jgi:hypothetical protein